MSVIIGLLLLRQSFACAWGNDPTTRRLDQGGAGDVGTRRFEQSDVLRTFLATEGYLDDNQRFLDARDLDTVTEACFDIMSHITSRHQGAVSQYVFSRESESDLIDSVGADLLSWMSGQLPGRRRLVEASPWNVTRRMSADTWMQSFGYVVAGKALLEDDRVESGAAGVLGAFGDLREKLNACARFVDSVNDQVQESIPTGLEYHPFEEIVSIQPAYAKKLGIQNVLGLATLATGQVVLALFRSCRRIGSAFGGATCALV